MNLFSSYYPEWVQGHKLFSSILIVALYFLLCSLTLVLYRLVFSEISTSPGPKLAAATYWYEFFFNYIRQEKYIFEIKRMHQKYGL